MRKASIVHASFRQLAKRSKYTIIIHKIYSNWLMKRQFGSGNIQSKHGSTHSRMRTPAESLNYINAQFDDYLCYSGISKDQLRGMRIFELGFGDNAGVALKFLAAGAAQAVCLDKFYSTRDSDQQRQIYRALRGTLSESERKGFDDAVNLENDIQFNPDRLKCVYGYDVEDAPDLASSGPFDLVLSRAAVQDIYEPDEAFAAMNRLLASTGVMLHKIDLSDQGMFRDLGFNPLTFLTIPDSVYRLMAVDSGRPNRKLTNYYREKMNELNYDTKLLVTGLIGRGGRGDLVPVTEKVPLGTDDGKRAMALLADIRPSLAPHFRNLSDDDLIVDSIFIIARKRQ
jgi:hypothetical protein